MSIEFELFVNILKHFVEVKWLEQAELTVLATKFAVVLTAEKSRVIRDVINQVKSEVRVVLR
jgi:hypothetical protein